jgi:hypothetical protein
MGVTQTPDSSIFSAFDDILFIYFVTFALPAFAEDLFGQLSAFGDTAKIRLAESVLDFVGDPKGAVLKFSVLGQSLDTAFKSIEVPHEFPRLGTFDHDIARFQLEVSARIRITRTIRRKAEHSIGSDLDIK